MTTTRAVLATSADEAVAVHEVSLDPLEDNDVLVRCEASGVCHTDLSIARGLTHQPFPIALGHEGAGTVVSVGPRVTRCAPGDKVILSWSTQCGHCFYCVRRQGHLCEDPGARGERSVTLSDGTRVPTASGLGTFAELLRVSELSVVPVRTELPFEQLAMIGCGVTTGVGAALWTARVEPGSTVAVFGCGGVGLSVIQGARIAGASRIIAIDLLDTKRRGALEFGATEALDPADGDIVEQLKALTAGRGVDYAFEVVGVPALLRQTLDSVRRGGMAVAVGMPPLSSTVEVPIVPLFTQEKHLVGSFYGSAQVQVHFPLLVEMAERGLLNLSHLVSERIGLHDVNDAFAAMSGGNVLRSVIDPQRS